MHPFEFVLAIIILILVFKLIKLTMMKSASRRENSVDSELLHRLVEVEERVRVLERIVTDERFDLKQQFKDLGS
jgi:hypothetical protein